MAEQKNIDQEKEFPGYPDTPSSEDIFKREKRINKHLEDEEENLEVDLDVPGAELDNSNEMIGAEDEENNYYSIGGDNHADLEESNPDDVDNEA